MRTVFLSHRRAEQEDADRLGARLPEGDNAAVAIGVIVLGGAGCVLSESWRRQVVAHGNVAASKWAVIIPLAFFVLYGVAIVAGALLAAGVG